MGFPRRYSAELPQGGVYLTPPVRTPAGNRPIGTDPTRMPIPGGHRAELSLRRGSLTVPVPTPAGNRPINTDPTGKTIATGNRCEPPTLRWFLGLGRSKLESTAQKRCHLSPSGVPARAVPSRTSRTPRRHTRSRQSINIRRVDIALNIHKPARSTLTKTESTNQKRRHLSTSNSLRRTEPQRPGSATRSDTQLSKTVHMRPPPLTRIHIRKPGHPQPLRVAPIDHPNQPHRHHPPPDRVTGAEHLRTALRPRQNTLIRQSLHRTPMIPSLINIRKPRTRISSRRSGCRNPHPQHHPNNSNHNPRHHPPTSSSKTSPNHCQVNHTEDREQPL